MKYELKKSTAMVYHIRILEPSRTWADITIEEWKEGGSFKCVSDYGNYSYIWGSIGTETLRGFLCQLNYDYFMGKTHPSLGEQFSIRKSITACRENIIEARRDCDITRAQARVMWEYLEQLEDAGNNENLYFQLITDSDIFDTIYENDYCSIPSHTEKHPQCAGFWRIIWPVAVEIWKEELDAALNKHVDPDVDNLSGISGKSCKVSTNGQQEK